MKILVSGGAGFIGSNVSLALEEKGAKVFIIDDFSHANFKNILDFKGEIIWADISRENIYKKLPRVDAVIHLAAITDTTFKDDRRMMEVNYKGFLNIIEWCLKKNIRIVYASSAGVYGNGVSPMKENQKLAPLNTYAYSKYCCDRQVSKIISRIKTPVIVGLRYFNVYGPREEHKYKTKSASMIYQLFLQMKDNKPPRIFKFGEQKRDFIYVKDVVDITLKALNVKKSVILNAGTGNSRSFNDIIKVLNKLLHKKLNPDYFDNPYSEIYQNHTEAETTLLKKFLRKDKFYSLEEGIEDYVNNYLLK